MVRVRTYNRGGYRNETKDAEIPVESPVTKMEDAVSKTVSFFNALPLEERIKKLIELKEANPEFYGKVSEKMDDKTKLAMTAITNPVSYNEKPEVRPEPETKIEDPREFTSTADPIPSPTVEVFMEKEAIEAKEKLKALLEEESVPDMVERLSKLDANQREIELAVLATIDSYKHGKVLDMIVGNATEIKEEES